MKKLSILGLLLCLALSVNTMTSCCCCNLEEVLNNVINDGSNDKAETVPPGSTSQADNGLVFTSNGDGTCYVSSYSDCGYTDIVIPSTSPAGDSVTSIGDSAFEYCSSLTSITIPDSVTSIGDWAFSECDSLTYNEYDNAYYLGNDNNPYLVLVRAKNNSITSCKIHAETKFIHSAAFSWCTSLTSITIPDSVTSIGESVFYCCYNLTSITIPDSVTSIGDWAFSECDSLTYNEYDNAYYLGNDNNPHLVMVRAKNNSITSCKIHEETKFIHSPAFYNCDSLTSITIPDSVTNIGDYAFYWCTSLTSITIPDSVTSIGDEVFYLCTSLTSITIPDSVTSIGDYAFGECYNLTSITIPDSVTSIGDEAFYCCTSLADINVNANNVNYSSIDGNLYSKDKTTLIQYAAGKTATSFVIPNSVTSIGERAFCCTSLTSITIPDGVTSIGDWAFSDCYDLTGITIPDSVTSIGDYSFKYCSSLTSITIPDSVTSIGNYAFSDCDSLTSITIPDSVTSIGDYVFYDCNSLTSITIPDSVTSIGDGVFSWCDSLESVKIGNGVTSIGEYAFYQCYSLNEINVSANNPNYCSMDGNLYSRDEKTLIQYATGKTATSFVIPNSVTSISDSAFLGCDGLIYNEYDNAYYLGNEENPYFVLVSAKDISITSCEIHTNTKLIHFEAFNRCYDLVSILIPDGVISIGGSAFQGCYELTSITIPNGVTSIGDEAFEDCSSLTSIAIPDGVTSIGNWAFSDCDSLTSITIPDSVTSIGYGAFYWCSSLTSVTFENPNGWWYSDYDNAESETSLSSSDLSDASVAAEYLTLTYADYYWSRD